MSQHILLCTHSTGECDAASKNLDCFSDTQLKLEESSKLFWVMTEES